MNILVTGGFGFIGASYLRKYATKDCDDKYFTIDIFNGNGNIENIKDLIDNKLVTFYECDIRDKEKVDEIFEIIRPDLVINFAAETSVDYSFKNPNIFDDVNVKGVSNLLEASIKYNVNRFHQISTDEVYGSYSKKGKYGFKPSHPLNPKNPYSLSKAKADNLCLIARKNANLKITISRSCNVFGELQSVDKLIPHSIQNVLNGRKIEVYGDGSNRRERIHVDALCVAINKIVTLNMIPKPIFHIASGVEYSNNEIAKMIIDELNLPDESIEYVTDREINDSRYLLYLDKVDSLIMPISVLTVEEQLRNLYRLLYTQKSDFLKNSQKRLKNLGRLR